MQKFYSIKPEDLGDPFFSHRIRWENGKKNTSFFSDQLLSALVDYQPLEAVASRLPSDYESRDVLSKAQVLEMDIFLSNYLLSSQGDRVAMANSVEIRLPFLDYRVIELAARLPRKWKIRGLNEKYILKQTFRNHIPEQIHKRTKQPYRAPIREVFFTDGSDSYVNELLSESYLKKTGYFNEAKVSHLVAKFQKTDQPVANETQNMALTGILSTQIAHHQFVENFPRNVIEPARPDKIIRK